MARRPNQDLESLTRNIGTSAPDGEGFHRSLSRDPAFEAIPEKTFHMRIAADGTWFHEGRPIRRKPLVKLFSTVLRRDEAGVYWLQTPVERGRIEVEDAPFVIEECRIEGKGHDRVVHLRSNIEAWVRLDGDHPLRVEEDPKTGEPRPYVRMDKGLEARLLRPVFYELADVAEAASDGSARLGLWSAGQFFDLGPAG